MSAQSLDRALLDRLAADALAGEPDPVDCDTLADRLVAVGATAAAARWRSWGLLPPGRPQLLEAITDANLQLLQGGVATPKAPAPRSAAWEVLRQRLAAGEPAAKLGAAVDQLLQEPLPEQDALVALSEALKLAQAPQAALKVLNTLRRVAPGDAVLCNRLAHLHRACGHALEAELWSRRSLKAEADQPMVWFQLAWLLQEQGALDEAVESAEAGLKLAPGHYWGLKIRATALAASGGWLTILQLQQRGGLPADAEVVAALEAEQRRWQGRAGLGGRQTEPALPLEERLRLRAALKSCPGPVLLVHGRSGAALRWLRAVDAWSTLPEIWPVGSRDPYRIADALKQDGYRLQPERSLRHLEQIGPFGLVVVERPPNRRLPLKLSPLLNRASLVLAPVGLLHLPGRRFSRQAGWELAAREPPLAVPSTLTTA